MTLPSVESVSTFAAHNLCLREVKFSAPIDVEEQDKMKVIALSHDPGAHWGRGRFYLTFTNDGKTMCIRQTSACQVIPTQSDVFQLLQKLRIPMPSQDTTGSRRLHQSTQATA